MALRRPLLGALLCLTAVLSLGASCRSGGPTRAEDDFVLKGSGPRISTSRDLKPDAAPDKKAILSLAGAKVPVSIEQKKQGNRMSVELLAHGDVIDHEDYETTPDAFSLVYAAGEIYNPPIKLLRFPMNIGDSWSWKGTMASEATAVQAEARITTMTSKVIVAGTSKPGVRVTVDIDILPASPKADAIRRTLAFEFTSGSGVVRREFGNESLREPSPS